MINKIDYWTMAKDKDYYVIFFWSWFGNKITHLEFVFCDVYVDRVSNVLSKNIFYNVSLPFKQ